MALLSIVRWRINKARTVVIGGLNPDYPGDQWHFALSRMTVACRAYGLRPIDGPFGDFSDPDGYTAGAKRVASLDGKMIDAASEKMAKNLLATAAAIKSADAARQS